MVGAANRAIALSCRAVRTSGCYQGPRKKSPGIYHPLGAGAGDVMLALGWNAIIETLDCVDLAHNVFGFIFLSCPIFPELNFPETAVFLRPSPTSKTKFIKFPEIEQFPKETHLEFLVISENFQPAASHIFCNRFNFRLPKFHGKRELRFI